MAEQVLLPLEDESDDLVMRLSAAEAKALHLLLSQLSYEELMAKGLTLEQAGLIDQVLHVCY